jgi:hypothetical protein
MLREREREGGSHACGLRCGEYGGLRGRQSGSGGGGRGGALGRGGWIYKRRWIFTTAGAEIALSV